MSNRLIMIATVATALVAGSVPSPGAILTGGEGNDTIIGTASADSINAKAGDDLIDGKENNDQLLSGLGNDTIIGGPGSDLLVSGQIGFNGSNYYLTTKGQSIVLKLDAGTGNDAAVFNALLLPGSEVNGGTGVDSINIASATTRSNRSALEYSYIVGFENWILTGDIGDEARGLITQNPGNRNYTDIVIEQGDVYISDSNLVGLETPLTVYAETAGYGQIIDASAVTSSGVIFKISTAQPDQPSNVIGGQSGDTFIGSLEPDFFRGNGGDDSTDGGEGIDTSIYSGNAADYTVTEVTYNSFTVQDTRPGSPDGTDTIVDVNKLQFADQTVDVVIRGLNIIGDEQADKLAGTAYADRLEGMGGNDELSGNAGNDQIIGGTGADRMVGGSGDDSYDFDSTGDTATEVSGGGIDTVRSSVSISSLSAYVENLTLTGSAALNATGNSMNNVITGNAGANVLSGGGGSDRLIGGPGDDTYYGNTSGVPGTDVDTVSFEDRAAAVTFNLALTSLQATGGAGNDRIPNGSIENLVGGSGGDRLTGTNGANRIEGRAGNDVIQGRLGADVLIGNGGLDVIYCGAETVNDVDTVTYLAAGDSAVGASRDQIVNFEPGDRINLSAIDANAKVAGNQAFTFNMTTPRANSVWYVKSGSNLIVRADVNGNTTPDFEILVKDRASLLSTDFVP